MKIWGFIWIIIVQIKKLTNEKVQRKMVNYTADNKLPMGNEKGSDGIFGDT